MYPSHANMFLTPIKTHGSQQRVADFHNSMEGWAEFLVEMRNYYSVDLDVLSESYRKEQKDYFIHTSQWTDTHPQQLLGPPSCFKKYDLHTLTLEELKAPMQEKFTMHVSENGTPVEAFCGYFDVLFKGSEQNPADVEVRLSTAPDPTGATHWGQQTFYINPPIEMSTNDSLECSIEVQRREDNHRLLKVLYKAKVVGESVYANKDGAPRPLHYNID